MSGDLGGFSLFDLFRGEAETHCRTLNEGLLALEARPDDLAAIEPLMRAAHSLKGAARIIGLDIAVTLAHAMEDVLVAAQKGRERLGSPRVDQLLRGTDTLAALASIEESALDGWIAANAAAVAEQCEQLAAPPPAEAAKAPTPAPTSPPPPPPPAPPPAPAPAVESPKEAAPDARTVRVSGDAIDRMMRLSGEMTIESRRFGGLRSGAAALRTRLLELDESIEALAQADDHARRTRLFGEAREHVRGALATLAEQAVGTETVARRVEETANALYHATLGSRMRPFVEGTHGFPRLVRDVAKELGKQVRFEVRGGTVAVDRDILAKLEAPLNHMIRNALDHGIEMPEERRAAGKDPTALIALEARHRAGQLEVRVVDDGRGIDLERVRRRIVERGLSTPELLERMSEEETLAFLFLPGFSTATAVTSLSGRGVGLDVVQRFAQEVGGIAAIETRPGAGTVFRFDLPVTLSVVRAVLVDIAGEPYAFPLARLERVVRIGRDELRSIEGRLHLDLDGVSTGLVDASALFGLPAPVERGELASILVLAPSRAAAQSGVGERYGLLVDRILGESDLVVRALPARLGKVAHIAAAALSERGDPILIADVDDLVQGTTQLLGQGRLRGTRVGGAAAGRRRRRVLVVDDSATVREVERQLLTRAGYEVDLAVDGVDGLNAMRSGGYDLLVSDVDMPRMNGIELVAAVRRDERFRTLPIVIVSYKDREEDRLAGLEAGANAYLTKGAFRDESFLRTVRDLIGEAHEGETSEPSA